MITEIYSKEKIEGMTPEARTVALMDCQAALMDWGKNTQITSQKPVMVRLPLENTVEFVGVHFHDRDAIKDFLSVTCPCGKVDKFPLNGFPEVDTPHSCGNPNHWVVKYEGGAI